MAFYEVPFLKTSKWRNPKACANTKLNTHMTVLGFVLINGCLDPGKWSHLSLWW